MKFISHRGNINKNDNYDSQLKRVWDLMTKTSYDVEIDVRKTKYTNIIGLGHDKSQEFIAFHLLNIWKNRLWIHAKDIATFNFMMKHNFNTFIHDFDDCALTTKGYLWIYPGVTIEGDKSIAVLPEEIKPKNLEKAYAICTDDILFWEREFNENN